MRKLAKLFVASGHGPLGPVPLRRVIVNNLPFLSELRCQGASWNEIATLLRDAGLRSSRGMEVSADNLRAAVSQARRRGQTATTPAASQIGARVSIEESVPAVSPRPARENPSATHAVATSVLARMRRAAALRAKGGGQ